MQRHWQSGLLQFQCRAGGGFSWHNTSNSPMALPVCSPGRGVHTILSGDALRMLDLFDTTRGKGFIEFKLVANVVPGTYPQPVSLSGTGFTTINDAGEIAVTASTVDTDGDGIVDATDPDDDNDGIPDLSEGNGTVDTDGDGIPDSRDLDSDNDGINDVREAGGLTDANGDGKADGADGDGNGMIDTPQNSPVDTDGDSVPDYRDLDSDNDGMGDLQESGSGLPDFYNKGFLEGLDSDGDGIIDVADGAPAVFGDAGDAGTRQYRRRRSARLYRSRFGWRHHQRCE